MLQSYKSGAFCALSSHAPEIVARRSIMRDEQRAPEARAAAAAWLAVNGTNSDQKEADRFFGRAARA